MSLATVSTRSRRQTAPKERHEEDWYVEPAGAVHALLMAEPFEGLTWDPCCGCGTIPRTMAKHGMRCLGSDVRDRAQGLYPVLNFIKTPPGRRDIENIVMNPPYGIAQQMIQQARGCAARKVAALCRLAFLEGKGRAPWFASSHLSRVLVFSDRISMPPGDLLEAGEVKPKGGAVAFAWFI